MFWLGKIAEKTKAARGLAVLLTVCAGLAAGVVAVSAQDIGTYAVVDAQMLNLRAAPDTRSSVIRTLPRRTVVSILDRKGGWVRVYVQAASGGPAEGWLSARFLGRDADTITGGRAPRYNAPVRRPKTSYAPYGRAGPLRVSKLDFDCRPPLFGNSGIRNCVASVRVQLSVQDYDPNRADSVSVACRGVITYRTDIDRHPRRIVAVERGSIARNDRLGQSVRVDFDVRSNWNKVISASLKTFSCARD